MRQFALIGHPVAHSVSPAIHRAAYRALGIDATYETIDCPERRAVEQCFELLRSGGLSGANVTIPWKTVALELADDADPLVRRVGAANVLVVSDGRIVAHNTDVGALVERIDALAVRRGRAAVIGSGGTALAAVAALLKLGFLHVVVSARRFSGDRADWPNAAPLGALGAVLSAWPDGPEAEWWDLAATSDVVIQATSAGMRGADLGDAVRDIVPWQSLRAGAAALDVVYNPPVTPFLAAALAVGLRAEGGLPMLVGQAQSAIELWVGRRPPPEPLLSAASRALGAT